jgi:hypothetical protein
MNILYRQALTWISKSSQRYFNFSQYRIFPEVVTRIDGSKRSGELDGDGLSKRLETSAAMGAGVRGPSEISPSLYGNTPLTDLFVGCLAFV